MITSPSNQHIAHLRTLHQPKGRAQSDSFLIEGPHLLDAAVTANIVPALIVYAPELLERTAAGRRTIGTIQAAESQGAAVFPAASPAIERAADTRTPQGVVAEIRLADVSVERIRTHRRGRFRPLLLVLDAIRDPGNVGTLLRSALAADVDEVLLSRDCADPYSPKVVRSGSGAHFHLPVLADQSWDAIRARLEGQPAIRQVLLAEATARQPYDAFDLTQRTALIIANEAHGPSAESIRLATDRLAIPMWNKVESLNAAIAGSVILFEAARQRRAHEAPSTTA